MPDPIDWQLALPYFLLALAGGYLLGSIPFGLVLTKLAGLGDVRRIGSGNIGATNVLRTGRKDLAALTLLLDAAKGAVAVLIAGRYGPDMAVCAALGALLGHLFPVWLRFKGGKGMATFLGVQLAIAWPVGIAACLTWLATAALFRMSSLAALVAAGLTPVFSLWLADRQRAELALVLVVLVFFRHHENIRRLLTGTEPKIGRGAKSTEPAARD
ncbi:glycerol-3-phosphate 1-O-acyltransferase PlsY [Desertibaculum subflavum]|uniref:glycerol-3-phosphate 1-O-acyltransferase PlsY n=1 Tax=Desertibaculum subflavum TaxID=2268458 RepID=UPI000E665D77